MLLVTCNPDHSDREQLELWITCICSILTPFIQITNAHVLEFFVQDHWSKVPHVWHSFLNQLNTPHLIRLLDVEQPQSYATVAPLGLLALRTCVHTYSLSRNTLSSSQQILSWFGKKAVKSHKGNSDSQLFNQTTTKHMSPKKQHEVTRMVNLLTNWFNDEKVQMLDCGSGKGHLARLLSLNRRFNVFTLEQQDDLRQKAQHYDRELLNSKEHKDGESDSLPRHLHFLLNDQNTYLVQSQLQGDFALIGLHSCGDLALSMLRFYHHSNTARALSLCFCCYHKANQLNCVLTDHLRSIGIELTMETRANACHAIETLLQTLRQEPHQILVHAYRSILEAILEQNRPEWRRRTLPKIRSAGKVDFNRYAQRAIRILNKDGSLDKTVFENSEAKRMLERSNQVTAFVCIRTLLGPLCETLLLLDKLLYVCQQVRGHAALFPLFDPHLSPRCFVLMATKCKEPL